jgi:hypothetical protein
MLSKTGLKGLYILFAGICFLLLYATKAEAIILHPENNLIPDTERPHDNVVGRWHDDASCVVIAPNYIITAVHQESDINIAKTQKVIVAGVSYTVDNIIQHTAADLRLVKLKHANFTEYVTVYTGTDETDTVAVLGGYGDGVGSILESSTTPPVKYGYSWDNSSNSTLRWGTNEIKFFHSLAETEDSLVTEFGRPYASNIKTTTTEYESAIADHDSGGGWFIYNEVIDEWQVMGLSLYVGSYKGIPEHSEQTWFLNGDNTDQVAPDLNFALRLSKYAEWIIDNMESTCDEYREADFNGDCVVDTADLSHLASVWLNIDCDESNNFCEHGDLLPDGVVDFNDFVVFTRQWLIAN